MTEYDRRQEKKSAADNAVGTAREETDMIFDTHVHYEDEAFDEDRDALVGSLPGEGIGRAVNVSSTVKSLALTKALTEKYDFLYGAYGLHPDEAGDLDDAMLETIRGYCRTDKAAAVGEIGLDYHWTKDNRKLQMDAFARQLALAREEKLPVIIHSRDAAADTLDVAKSEKLGEIGGVMHCFSYPTEIARQYLDMGIYLGVGGVVTFKNARRLKEVVSYVPLESIVLETDCPYMAPEPHRGRRNSSRELPYVVRAIAGLKGVTAEEVEETTWKNAMKLFRMTEGEKKP